MEKGPVINLVMELEMRVNMCDG